MNLFSGESTLCLAMCLLFIQLENTIIAVKPARTLKSLGSHSVFNKLTGSVRGGALRYDIAVCIYEIQTRHYP